MLVIYKYGIYVITKLELNGGYTVKQCCGIMQNGNRIHNNGSIGKPHNIRLCLYGFYRTDMTSCQFRTFSARKFGTFVQATCTIQVPSE